MAATMITLWHSPLTTTTVLWLSGFCPGLPRWAGTSKLKPKPIWISWSKGQWVAWDHLCHMQICISRQADNHASTPPLSFLQPGCPSCRPTNSVKALKALKHWRLFKALTFTSDLRTDACRAPAMNHISTNFGADSSSHFPFRAWTHTETQTKSQT